jgi:hypothetical protein
MISTQSNCCDSEVFNNKLDPSVIGTVKYVLDLVGSRTLIDTMTTVVTDITDRRIISAGCASSMATHSPTSGSTSKGNILMSRLMSVRNVGQYSSPTPY